MDTKEICFACLEEKVLTEEHIIVEAIGGKLKHKIYCGECNNEFGEKIDSEVFERFGFLAITLGIKTKGKRKGRRLPQFLKGENLKTKTKISFNGQDFVRKDPVVKIEVAEDGKTLKFADVRARSEKELKRIVSEINKKYKVSGKSKTFREYHPGPTDLKSDEWKFDTKLIRRAVTKMVYSFICLKLPRENVLSDSFDEIRLYIKTGKGVDMASANFVHTQFMSDYIGRPLHKICISFNKHENLVIGYIMLFGIYRYTVLLSRNYKSILEWPGFDYTLDPVTSQEVPVKSNFRAPYLKLNEILQPKHSLQLLNDEISQGYKNLENYTNNYKFEKLDLKEDTKK